MTPQAGPTFIQQRGQSNFAFGGTLGQPALQQQPSQQQQTNGTSGSISHHLSQTPNLAAASVSSASDVGLDPNDFPALGSTSTSNNATSSTNNNNIGGNGTTSYASQAGTGIGVGGTAGTGSSAVAGAGAGGTSQPREFTPDDFPALGGQPQPPSQNQTSSHQAPIHNQAQENHSHPPGLNGFPHMDHSQQQQHRQNLLGTLTGLQTPGMLNLGPTRNVHPGFQQGQGHSEAEKQQQRVSAELYHTEAVILYVLRHISDTACECISDWCLIE